MNDNVLIPETILALDVPDRRAMQTVLDRLPAAADFFKVGLELFCAEGPSILAELRQRNARVFLDLKLHDIPRTVERAVSAAARWNVEMLTIHAGGGPAMIRAAVEAARSIEAHAPKIIAVTVLTSLDASDLAAIGFREDLSDQVKRLADLARAHGADGVVCSAMEVAEIRRRLGPEACLITPGIRLGGGNREDQKRTATPEQAARDGASAIVVGRPVFDAPDPERALGDIRDALRRGTAERVNRPVGSGRNGE